MFPFCFLVVLSKEFTFRQKMRIYENDIIECHHLFDDKIIFRGVIKQNKGCFGIEVTNKSGSTFISFNELIEYSYKVVGNVFKIIPKENTSNNIWCEAQLGLIFFIITGIELVLNYNKLVCIAYYFYIINYKYNSYMS